MKKINQSKVIIRVFLGISMFCTFLVIVAPKEKENFFVPMSVLAIIMLAMTSYRSELRIENHKFWFKRKLLGIQFQNIEAPGLRKVVASLK